MMDIAGRWLRGCVLTILALQLASASAQDVDGDGLIDTAERSLAEQYAPVLRLTPSESFFPVPILYALDNSELRQIISSGNRTLASSPTVQTISVYVNPDGKYYLDNVRGGVDDEGIRDHFLTVQVDITPTIYARVIPDPPYTVIQYWLYYPFNDGPLNSHEGDWEMVQVKLTEEGPVSAAYSQHFAGQSAEWGDVLLRDDHPVVYVARGSHANYFRSYQGVLGVQSDEVSGSGPALSPEDYEIVLIGELGRHEPADGWLKFAGRWGEWGEDADGLRGRRGPPGPAQGQNSEKWEDPDGWDTELRVLNTRWLWLSWLAANFLALFVVYVVFRGAWSLLHTGKALKERRLLAGVSRGALLAVTGAVIAVIAAWQPWYFLDLNVSEGEYKTDGYVTVMQIDGVKGVQVSDPQSNRGLVGLFTAHIPVGLLIISSLAFLVLDIIKAGSPGQLRRRFVRGGITRLLIPVVPVIVLIIMMGFIVSSVASEMTEEEVPDAVTEMIDSIQGSPLGGRYVGEISDIGDVKLRWGLGIGSIMMLAGGALILLGGITTAPTRQEAESSSE